MPLLMERAEEMIFLVYVKQNCIFDIIIRIIIIKIVFVVVVVILQNRQAMVTSFGCF